MNQEKLWANMLDYSGIDAGKFKARLFCKYLGKDSKVAYPAVVALTDSELLLYAKFVLSHHFDRNNIEKISSIELKKNIIGIFTAKVKLTNDTFEIGAFRIDEFQPFSQIFLSLKNRKDADQKRQGPLSSKERLVELKGLLDGNLITQVEYDRERERILKNL